jgi:CRISPR-associated protein Cmr1
MQELTFKVQTVTPLFMAGASKETAELRVPSFRGEMRYWFRALAGGIVGTDTRGLEQVKALEASVFGTTDRGSAVSMRIANIKGTPREFTEPISEKINGQRQATGKSYLLWSMARSGREGRNLKPARRYFPPKTTFDVTLSTRDLEDTSINQATAAFWLLTSLGGIGSRSRRCAGSLLAETQATTEFLFKKAESVQALKHNLEQGIIAARQLCHLHQRPVREAHFDALSKETCRIWILQNRDRPWSTAEDVMSAIGADLQWYRGEVPLRERKIFGLPLRDVSNARRASPLLLRVTELQGNKSVGIAVLFKTAYRDINMSDYDEIVADWVETFDKSIEVTL